MKNIVFIVLFALATQASAQQGAAVARDVREYVTAKKTTGFEQAKTSIEPKAKTSIEPKASTSIEPKREYSIGGQRVDEANSTIFKAFRQNPHWESLVLVADCTASMYPYIGQIVAWHQSNLDKKLLLDIILFNDGDDRIHPQPKLKKDGETGGIYQANPDDMEQFLATMATAIDAGDGGDAPENDLEALLFAQKKYPQAKYLVLVADNSAIRDMSLLPKIQKPVHVILCNSGWVIDYVRLAYETGGSITLLGDQLDFSKKKTVDKRNIQLGGIRYSLD